MGRVKEPAFAAFFAVLCVCSACLIVLIATPRFPPLDELPPLVLAPDRVRSARAADDAWLKQALTGPLVQELRQLYLEEGRAEASERSDAMHAWRRQERMWGLARSVLAEVGSARFVALRALATEQFMQQLSMADGLVQPEAAGLCGRFPELMRRYGMMEEGGRMIAPEQVVRAMYAARWNMLHGLEPAHAFSEQELCAYLGWIALHAASAPPERRLAAAEGFARAGCRYGAETLAQWQFLEGRLDEGLASMQAIYEENGSLRARNLALHMLSLKRGLAF